MVPRSSTSAVQMYLIRTCADFTFTVSSEVYDLLQS